MINWTTDILLSTITDVRVYLRSFGTAVPQNLLHEQLVQPVLTFQDRTILCYLCPHYSNFYLYYKNGVIFEPLFANEQTPENFPDRSPCTQQHILLKMTLEIGFYRWIST